MGPSRRLGRAEYAPRCGSICFDAFKALADQHDFLPDFPSTKMAASTTSRRVLIWDLFSGAAFAGAAGRY
jgi:hypothetical protein